MMQRSIRVLESTLVHSRCFLFIVAIDGRWFNIAPVYGPAPDHARHFRPARRRPLGRPTSPDPLPEPYRAPCDRLDAGRVGEYTRDLRRYRRRFCAALDEGAGCGRGLDHRGVLNAPL